MVETEISLVAEADNPCDIHTKRPSHEATMNITPTLYSDDSSGNKEQPLSRTVFLRRNPSNGAEEKTGIGIRFGRPGTVTSATSPYSIQEVLEGPANQCGLVFRGDLLLKVNGTEVQELTVEQVTALIKGKPGSSVSLTLTSPILLEKQYSEASTPITNPEAFMGLKLDNAAAVGSPTTTDIKEADPTRCLWDQDFCLSSQTKSHFSVRTAAHDIGGAMREVSLNRSPAVNGTEETGIGLVFGRHEFGHGPMAPYKVIKMFQGGTAHQSGLIYTGDLLHQVDGVEVKELSVEEITELIIGKPSSAITITVSTPSAAAEHHFRTDKPTNTASDLVHGPCYAEQNVRGDISPPTLSASSSQGSPKSSPTLTCQPTRPGSSSPLLGGLASFPSENLKGKALKGTVMSSRSPKASGMLFSAFSLCPVGSFHTRKAMLDLY